MKRHKPEDPVVRGLRDRLVQDYGYPPDVTQTDPQHRIRTSPSATETYPLDLAVFRSPSRLTSELYLIGECKAPTKDEGLEQLRILLQNSPGSIGIWFNGMEHAYLWKKVDAHGLLFVNLPDIPAYGQRVEDLGKFLRGTLVRPSNLKAIFTEIRNYLVGAAAPGITRDQEIAAQIINVIFCKIYDELNTPSSKNVSFYAGAGEAPADVATRIRRIFNEKVKASAFSDIFSLEDRINLADADLFYVVGALQRYLLTEAERDAVGEAFEIFVGPALRGEEGQFFTPRNVVKMMVRLIKPKIGEVILDPACGSGGFLVETLRELWGQLELEGRRKGWRPEYLGAQRREVANRFLRGIDKDQFLVKVARAYMAILGDGREMVFCENALVKPSDWVSALAQERAKLGEVEALLTNPPHGARITAKGLQITGQYDLACSWSKKTGSWRKGHHKEKAAVPILFLERCFQFLRPNGRMAIVFPETYLGMPGYGYVPRWLLENMCVRAVIGMPEDLFQPHTHNKVAIILAEKAKPSEEDDIVFATVHRCGHDSRGLPIPFDDVPKVTDWVLDALGGRIKTPPDNCLGFVMKRRDLTCAILVPRYYDPQILEATRSLSDDFEPKPLGALEDEGVIEVGTGVEVGKLAYGTGTTPFIRTSDLANFEVKIDPKQGVSKEIYLRNMKRASVQPNDILMVRDGTYLVGTSAIVTEYDPAEMLIQAEILRFRVEDPSAMDPYLLLGLINTPYVKAQIRSKQFTRGVIDTLGHRWREVKIPIPRNKKEKNRIARAVRNKVLGRAKLKAEIRHLITELISPTEEERPLP